MHACSYLHSHSSRTGAGCVMQPDGVAARADTVPLAFTCAWPGNDTLVDFHPTHRKIYNYIYKYTLARQRVESSTISSDRYLSVYSCTQYCTVVEQLLYCTQYMKHDVPIPFTVIIKNNKKKHICVYSDTSMKYSLSYTSTDI